MVLAIIVLALPIVPVSGSFQATEPFERPATYQVVDARQEGGLDLSRGVYTVVRVALRNTDSLGGTFRVRIELYTVNGLFGVQDVDAFIPPGGIQSFTAEFDTEFLQDTRGEYEVFPPTVIDQHIVTKYQTTYRSLAELLLSGRR